MKQTILLERENIRDEVWEMLCWYLGLIGNHEGELDSSYYELIEVSINRVETSIT